MRCYPEDRAKKEHLPSFPRTVLYSPRRGDFLKIDWVTGAVLFRSGSNHSGCGAVQCGVGRVGDG